MNEQSLFIAALEHDPQGRRDFLQDACGGDGNLLRRVEQLLAAHENVAECFLQQPAGDFGQTVAYVENPTLGAQIGPYKLLQQIGEGGMGTVYMAEQTHPVQRKVALKLIKAGMDSRQVIARFEAERQALAVMDHVNIARVLDAGATEQGRPYFVMELVHGVPITKYCDDNHLTPRQRLELFVPVCQAIQHAHQKGIIHRDIKPSNVMVTLYDGKPVPKVIDFGVAKATEQKLIERTLFTQYGTMVGTLEYMSPEQAEMSALGVDTRSDIFSLGVLLYELLTGSTPLTHKRMKEAAYGEILRMIKEEEPPKPSTRLSDSGEALASISANRHTEPAKLSKLMLGELDWIVMKSLEKDRNRRYETANGFAADVQRYLNDDPVLACPPTAGYRLRKFVRRNKAALATSVLVGATLLTCVVVLAVSNVRITGERNDKAQALVDKDSALRSETAALKRAREQEQLAAREAQRAQQQEDAAKWSLYCSRMNSAAQHLRSGQVGRCLQLLESLRPASGELDRRGFEWQYLWHECHRGLRLTLEGHRGEVFSLKYSPDGERLASAGADTTVKLWNASNGNLVRTFEGLNGKTSGAVAFSPDGRLLASACDRTVVLCDVETGQRRSVLDDFQGTVLDVVFSPDGMSLATLSPAERRSGLDFDSEIRLWDVKSQQVAKSFTTTGSGWACQLAFSPDGRTLAQGRGRAWILVLDVLTGKQRYAADRDWVGGGSIAFSPGGTLLAQGTGTGKVRLLDQLTFRQTDMFDAHTQNVSAVAFSKDGSLLASAGADGCLKLWDLQTRTATTCGHTGAISAIDFSPKAPTVASAGVDGVIKVWGRPQPVPPAGTEKRGNVWSLAFSADGKALASYTEKGTAVELREVATGTVFRRIDQQGVDCVALARDGCFLAAGTGAGAVVVVDRDTGETLRTLQHHRDESDPERDHIHALEFSPDSRRLASAGNNCLVKIWNVQSGALEATLAHPKLETNLTHTDWIWSLAFSPDGKSLASASRERVKLWDLATNRERAEMPVNCVWQQRIAFSPDSARLAAFDDRQQVLKIWDAQTGSLLATLCKSELAPSHCMAISPDWTTVATGRDDGSITFWDLATGRERATIANPTGTVWVIVFAPDGKSLAFGTWNGAIQFMHACSDRELSAKATLQNSSLVHNDLLTSADAQPAAAARLDAAVEEYTRSLDSLPEKTTWQGERLNFWREAAHSEELIQRLTKVRVPDAYCHIAQGLAWAEQGRIAESAAAHVRALDSWPDRGKSRYWGSPRMRLCMLVARSPAVLDAVLAQRPNDQDLRVAVARQHHLHQRWEEGLAAFEQVRTTGLDHQEWCEYAGLLLLCGKRDEYQQCCRQRIDQLSADKSLWTGTGLARVCALGNQSAVEHSQAIEWAERGLKIEPMQLYVLHIIALSHFRAQQYERAQHWIAQSNSVKVGAESRMLNEFLLAMIDHHEDRVAEARVHFREACRLLDAAKLFGNDGVLSFSTADWVEAHVLRREAEALIEKVPPARLLEEP